MTIASGYFWKFFPFYIHRKESSYEVIELRNYVFIKLINALAILSNVCIILMLTLAGVFLNKNDAVLILMVGFDSMFIWFIGVQLWYITYMESISRILGQFIKFNSQLRNII